MEQGTSYESGLRWRRGIVTDQTSSFGYGEIVPEELLRGIPEYFSYLFNPTDTYHGVYWPPLLREEKIILSRADVIELYKHAMEKSAILTKNSLEKEINILKSDNVRLRRMLNKSESSKISEFRLPDNYFDEDFEDE